MEQNHCKICSHSTEMWEHKGLKTTYYYCLNCQFLYKDHNQIPSPEQELKIYNNHNNSIHDPRYVAFFYRFLDQAVFPYINDVRKGLDFGSGPSPVLAKIFEQYHDIKMDIYDLFYAPKKVYENQKYPLITCTEVVEHLKNPLDYFHLFHDHLSNNGILAIMTLFHPNDEEKLQNWHYVRDPSHISFYTEITMDFIAEKMGFNILHCDHKRYTTFQLNK